MDSCMYYSGSGYPVVVFRIKDRRIYVSLRSSLREAVIMKLINRCVTIKKLRAWGKIIVDINNTGIELLRMISKINIRRKSVRTALKKYVDGELDEKRLIEELIPEFLADTLSS